MSSKSSLQKSPYDLAEHNSTQLVVFYFLIIAALVCIFYLMLPVLQRIFFEYFLHGKVYNRGEEISYYIDGGDLVKTNKISKWGVDIYLKTALEGRYWFDPIISLLLPSFIFALAFSVLVTTLMPSSSGFMRQKIEREIALMLNSITLSRYGYEDTSEHPDLINEIRNANLKELHSFSEEWNMTFEDLRVLQKAIIWRDAGLFYRIIHFNDGLTMYMRFYFTVKYSNAVLGFVYVGAAVLIIIIGLRGLKFIPPNQPSLVLFALGLEFSLLISYAFVIMYARQEEEFVTAGGTASNEAVYMSSDFGNSKEVEKLLRVFINIKRKSGKDK